MNGYGQYCPIALAAEVFAERWTPIVIRNLHLGCRHFGEILEGAPGMPRSVLAQRLRTLTADGVVTCTRQGRSSSYELTEMGHELTEVCMALGVWGARWRAAQPEDQDPYLALWTMSRLLLQQPCARPRVNVRFDVPGRGDHDRFWLVLDHVSGNEVCTEYPGYVEDGVVVSDTASLVRWYAGEVSLFADELAGRVDVSAPPWLERELVRWGHLSPFAGIEPVLPEPVALV